MTYLIIFWWGSFSGQQTHIEFSSSKRCESALVKIMDKTRYVAGNVSAWCQEK